MIGQVLRQFGRVVAAYFSDVLLWISVAGALEVVAVVGMAALCILSAGYFFDTMKKNPVVLVLGGVVALTGTFLMFREVRGFIWEAPPVAIAAPAPGPSFEPLPTSPSPEPAPQAQSNNCIGATQLSCILSLSLNCQWVDALNACVARPTIQPSLPPATWLFPRTYQGSSCTQLSATGCMAANGCYWSSLFNRCEKLIVGSGLAAPTPQPALPNCYGVSQWQCAATPGCTWSSDMCLIDFLGGGGHE